MKEKEALEKELAQAKSDLARAQRELADLKSELEQALYYTILYYTKLYRTITCHILTY